MSQFLNPFIQKQSMVAANQVLQIILMVSGQVLQSYKPQWKANGYVLTARQVVSLSQVVLISVMISLQMQDGIKEGFNEQLLQPIKKIMGGASNDEEENLLEEESEQEKTISIFGNHNCDGHHQEVGGVHNHEFNHNFEQKLKESDDVISMVSNLKFINSILVGMTELLDHRVLNLD